METPIETALERIIEAANNNAKELDLKGLGLETLPVEIGTLWNLIRLDAGTFIQYEHHLSSEGEEWDYDGDVIHANSITHLPQTIGNLKNLEVLILKSNRLEKLPYEINELKRLKTLD